jgi:hypothetical protein
MHFGECLCGFQKKVHFCDFFLALLCGYVYKENMNGREWFPGGMRQRLLEGTDNGREKISDASCDQNRPVCRMHMDS